MAHLVQDALVQMPSESTLIQMKVQLDRRIKEQENRQFVDETVQACRDLRPREAVELLRNARRRLPGDERLLNLEGLLTERLMQQSLEERREEILSLAHSALDAGKYADAVHILEVCQQEGIGTQEIHELLEVARQEEAEHRRQDVLRDRIEHAQSLIADSAFDEAITYLEEALRLNDDAALRLLLEKAIAGSETYLVQIEGVLTSAHRLAIAGKHAEAISFLRGQSSAVQRSPRVQMGESAIGDEQLQSAYRSVGRAYAAIQNNLSEGASLMQRVKASLGDSTLAVALMESFQSRIQVLADQMIEDLVGKSKTFIRNRDRARIAESIDRGKSVVEFAGPKARANWKTMLHQTEKAGLAASLRG